MPTEFFDRTESTFQTMKDKYGIWPTTVWRCNIQDPLMQAVKREIGDIGGLCLRKGTQRGGHASFPGEIGRSGKKSKYRFDSVYGGKITASVFNPTVAQILINCYAPNIGICFDPFGGGGTRAIIAAKNGLQYIGVEIRKEEVQAVYDRCKHCGVLDSVTIIHGNSQECPTIENNSADFCYTCPPYYNLEKYEGGKNDLSMSETYEDFLSGIEKVIAESHRILKVGSFSCWVVGLHRNKEGELLAINHDIAKLHQQNGFFFKEEIILFNENTGAIQRIGSFEKGNRQLIRVHEYALIFVRM